MAETITSLSVIELLERRGARPAIITVEGEATREHGGAEIAAWAERLAVGLRAVERIDQLQGEVGIGGEARGDATPVLAARTTRSCAGADTACVRL